MERTQPVAKKTEEQKTLSKDGMVVEFLEKFALSLMKGDVKAIASLWSVPSYVLGDEMVEVLNSTDRLKKFFSGAKERYNSRGIGETIPDVRKLSWITDRLAIVEVRWPYLNAEGAEIGDETSTYTLRLEDSGDLKIHVVAFHGSSKSH